MKAYVAAIAAALLCAAPAFAQAPEEAPAAAAPAKEAKPISYFFGIFQGTTKVVTGAGAGTAEASGRMSRVETTAAGKGFTITWSTLYIDDENPSEVKVKDSTEITFDATDSATVFKQKGAPELWSGKPHYWARIDGNTLHVSALVLDADGTYDVTHYARTVDGDAMRLEFTRFKDGQLQREVTGTLNKTAE
ncbi:hypothetical protein sos41_37640 [Alphaproteobacteria bacterium SO-S41]|nr:hypothetical protein sos41_37640 [Alphaproteobacteria bacterium SO-S41]